MYIKVVASGMLFSKLFTFVFSVLNFVFLATSLYTTSLNFFNYTGTVFNLPKPKSSTFILKSFKLVGTLASLLMSSFPTSAFKAMKFFLPAKSDVSTPVA